MRGVFVDFTVLIADEAQYTVALNLQYHFLDLLVNSDQVALAQCYVLLTSYATR